MRYTRIIFDIMVLISILFAPLIVTFILCIIGLISWVRYYEAIIAAVCIELLFRGAPTSVFGVPYLYAMIAILLIFFLSYARTVLRTK